MFHGSVGAGSTDSKSDLGPTLSLDLRYDACMENGVVFAGKRCWVERYTNAGESCYRIYRIEDVDNWTYRFVEAALGGEGKSLLKLLFDGIETLDS